MSAWAVWAGGRVLWVQNWVSIMAEVNKEGSSGAQTRTQGQGSLFSWLPPPCPGPGCLQFTELCIPDNKCYCFGLSWSVWGELHAGSVKELPSPDPAQYRDILLCVSAFPPGFPDTWLSVSWSLSALPSSLPCWHSINICGQGQWKHWNTILFSDILCWCHLIGCCPQWVHNSFVLA